MRFFKRRSPAGLCSEFLKSSCSRAEDFFQPGLFMVKMVQISRQKHSPPDPLSRRAIEGVKIQKRLAPWPLSFGREETAELLNLIAKQANFTFFYAESGQKTIPWIHEYFFLTIQILFGNIALIIFSYFTLFRLLLTHQFTPPQGAGLFLLIIPW